MRPAAWTDEHHLEVDGWKFVASPTLTPANRPDGFVIIKAPELVRRYLTLLETEAPKRIVELGVREGGSTALLALAGEPELLLAVDIEADAPPLLTSFLATRPEIGVRFGLDQADRAGLIRFLDQREADELDLVIDDASHMLQPTRTSFEVLFPRLRSGGVYIVEDWASDWQIANAVARLHPNDVIARFSRASEIVYEALNVPDLPGEINAKIRQAAAEAAEQGGRTFLECIAEAVDRDDIAAAFTVSGRARRPLADLAVELTMIRASTPDVMAEVCIDGDWLLVRRGTADLRDGWRLDNCWSDHFGYLP